MVGLAASDFSFAAASDLLWELAAVRVETKQVERAAEALGREVADDERDVAETVPSPAPTLYLGLDGTGVPVCGRPKGATRRAGPCATAGRFSYNAAVESAASRDTDPLPSAFAQLAGQEDGRETAGDGCCAAGAVWEPASCAGSSGPAGVLRLSGGALASPADCRI